MRKRMITLQTPVHIMWASVFFHSDCLHVSISPPLFTSIRLELELCECEHANSCSLNSLFFCLNSTAFVRIKTRSVNKWVGLIYEELFWELPPAQPLQPFTQANEMETCFERWALKWIIEIWDVVEVGKEKGLIFCPGWKARVQTQMKQKSGSIRNPLWHVATEKWGKVYSFYSLCLWKCNVEQRMISFSGGGFRIQIAVFASALNLITCI